VICPRCPTEMVHSHHTEVEEVSPEVVHLTQVFTDECPVCSALCKWVYPMLPEHLAQS